MTVCETVNAVFYHNGYGIANLTMPAFSRTEESLRKTVEIWIDQYITQSDAMGTSKSLADFTLFLAKRASAEDREQEEIHEW